jgi:2,3-bisphosphoglycerate-independent phosphoglycerate mutase
MLNKIDREFIGPLIDYLGDTYRDTYRLAVLPDHYTYADTGAHGSEPVPYVVFGYGKDEVEGFSERAIAQANPAIIKSYEFMDLFLKG